MSAIQNVLLPKTPLRNAIHAFARAAVGLTAGLALCAPLLGAEVSGYVKREVFYAPGTGEPYANPPVFSNPNFPNSPDAVTYVDAFAVPQTANPNVEDFLDKLSGFIHPATTGDYVFFFSSDDHGAFYLSTDDNPANLKLVARETGWSNFAQWQTSGGGSTLADKNSATFTGSTWPGGATIHLEAGKKYYAEAYDREGGGGDDDAVTMVLASTVVTNPDDPTQDVPLEGDPSTLTGALISTEAPTTVSFLKQPPASQTVVQGRQATFSVTAVTPPGDPAQDNTLVVPALTYQWRKDGTDIPIVDADGDGVPDPGSSGTSSYVIPAVAIGDAGVYTCKITTPSSLTLVSTDSTLVVPADTVPPTFTAAAGDGNAANATTTVDVVFSENMDTNVVTSFALSGGVTVSSSVWATSTEVILTTSAQPAGTLTLTVTGAKDVAGNALAPNTATFPALVFQTGEVNLQRWNSTQDPDDFITGDYLTVPRNYSTLLTQFYYPQTAPNLDNFVSHISGWFLPPVTGDYVFFFSSDDHGSLYLSTDETPANLKLIAKETAWSNAGDWATSGNTGADLPSKRSDQFADTTWPTAATITLTAGKKYYIESFAHEGGGGDYNTATYKLASDPDPAAGSTLLTGSVIGTFVDPLKLPPTITKRPTGTNFNPGDTLTFTVEASSPLPLTYQWYKTKHAIPGATSATLTIPNAGVADIGDYYVDVSTVNATASSFPDNDSRAVMKGAFDIEVEDFNYGGGQTLAAASVMPLASDLYTGKDGLPGIDFHLATQSTTDASLNGNNYRQGWIGSGVTNTFPTAPEALGNVDVVIDNGNTNRPDFNVTNNYKIGWGAAGDWYQYTRSFPAGNYNAVAAYARDGRTADSYGLALEIVTGDITKTNAATTVVGQITASGSGAWSSDDLMPFSTPGGTDVATFALGANTTVRLRIAQNDPDIDYVLFYPAGAVVTPPTVTVKQNADGSITVSWTGTGKLQSAETLNGTFTDVPGATSPFTFTPTTAELFGRVLQ